MVAIAEHPASRGQAFNLGGSFEVSIMDLARRIIQVLGSDSPISLVPYEQAYGQGYEDMRRRVPDNTKARRPRRLRPDHHPGRHHHQRRPGPLDHPRRADAWPRRSTSRELNQRTPKPLIRPPFRIHATEPAGTLQAATAAGGGCPAASTRRQRALPSAAVAVHSPKK